jgi:hypothetical protein
VDSNTVDLCIRRCAVLATYLFAAWVGGVSLLPTEHVAEGPNEAGCAQLRSDVRVADAATPTRLSRLVTNQLPIRAPKTADEKRKLLCENLRHAGPFDPPSDEKLSRETFLFCIVSPDQLIELPGTPPPAALC